MSITPKLLKQITDVFNLNGWSLTNDDEDPLGGVFNRFILMLEKLDEDEQTLILKLLENFLHLPSSQYFSKFRNALSKIPSSAFEQCEKIEVVPALPIDDHEKIKSANHLLYEFSTSGFRSNPIAASKFNERKNIYRNFDALSKSVQTRTNSLIIMIDDYIGTGKTALKAYEDFCSVAKASSDNIIIISLVAQKEGLEILRNRGINVFCAIECSRGISDSLAEIDRWKAIKTMIRLEKKLGIDKKSKSEYRFGFGRSQALVKLMRTPNNTFPIFWLDPKPSSAHAWEAPFPRYNS